MWSGACGAMVCGALQPRNSSCRHELGRPVRAVLGAAGLMRVPIVTCYPGPSCPCVPVLLLAFQLHLAVTGNNNQRAVLLVLLLFVHLSLLPYVT